MRKLLAFLACFFWLANFAVFGVTTALMPPPFTQFLDNNGHPLSGGFVFTYQAGTSTPQATYTDSTGATANANPIVLDAGGFPSSGGNRVGVWLQSGLSYKIVVQNFASVQQWAADNVVEFLGSSVAGGSTTQVQYNCSGSFCGNAGFTYTVGSQTANLVALNLTSGGTFAGSIGGTPTFTGALVFSGNPSFTGSPSFSTGTPVFNNGANMGTGTFSGANTFSGNKIFSGTPVFQTGASLTGTFSGNPAFSGTPSFSGTPTYSNGATFSSISPTAPTASPGDNTTKVATTAFVAAAIPAVSGSTSVHIGSLYFQWATGPTRGNSEGTDTTNLPVTCPTAIDNVQVTYVKESPGSGSDDAWYQIDSTTTSTVVTFKQSTGGTSANSHPYVFVVCH